MTNLVFVPGLVNLQCWKHSPQDIFLAHRKLISYLHFYQHHHAFPSLKNSPKIGSGSITVRNDPRVLPFGKFLRKTKINELPQIINVLKGEMSIVGPRPQMKVDFEKFPEVIRDEIYKSKPGITGIGSIVFRDEEKWISNHKGDKHQFYKEKIAPYKTDLELWYLKNQSILVDLKLILITALVIIFPKLNVIDKFFKSLPAKPSHLN